MASGSEGATASRRVSASTYRLMSLPVFASTTAALRASTLRKVDREPTTMRRSSLVRPGPESAG